MYDSLIEEVIWATGLSKLQLLLLYECINIPLKKSTKQQIWIERVLKGKHHWVSFAFFRGEPKYLQTKDKQVYRGMSYSVTNSVYREQLLFRQLVNLDKRQHNQCGLKKCNVSPSGYSENTTALRNLLSTVNKSVSSQKDIVCVITEKILTPLKKLCYVSWQHTDT